MGHLFISLNFHCGVFVCICWPHCGGYLKLPKEKKPPPFPYTGLLMLGIDWGINYTFHSHVNKRNFKMIAWGPKPFFAQEPFYANWTVFGTPRKGQEPFSQASIILKMIQEPRKIETTAHRASLYSCGLQVLQAQGLVVHNMNSLQIFTDLGFNIMGDELLLNFGTKFQP